MENNDNNPTGHRTREHSRTGTAWIGAAIMVGAIFAFYVLREHWGHVLGFAPYVILLVCPLMHIFMHGEHGHGHEDKK